MTTEPWPWPKDTALMRRTRIARSYREALLAENPETCQRLDEQMRRYGQRWIIPTPATYNEDDYLTAEHVADYAGVNLATVYTWRWRGMPSITTNDGIRFRFADVAAWVGGRRDG